MKAWTLFLLLCSVAALADEAALVRDRAAIEQVYYDHRLGQKPPFEQATPPALIGVWYGETCARKPRCGA
jgi:hypothetical protein